ncbi:MAG: ion transporter [Nitrososphaerota archaeon]
MRRLVEAIVALLAVISLFTLLLDYLIPLSPDELALIYAFDFVVVAVLAADFYLRASRSGNIRRYLSANWYELLALTPAYLFYVLEGQPFIGAVLRGLRLVRVVRLAVALPRVVRAFNILTYVLRASRLLYLMAISAVVVSVGGVTVFILEAHVPGSKIVTISDALWWALATVTTVGYGDVVPVTTEGRILGSIIMLSGISIIGIFISTLGATFVTRYLEERATSDNTIKDFLKKKIDDVENLSEEELETLVEMIKALNRRNSYTKNGKGLNPAE